MSGAKDPIITATAPFDNPDGDIILRSANGVDFHVFKLILSLMSPVFKDMFTLPQNCVSSVPVIPLTESSTTLESLLLLCYPAATPTFDSLDNAKAVMEAAKKYDMQAVLNRAGDLVMSQFLPTHFLDMYALSCRFGWRHHAQTAATRSLEIKNLGRPSTEFENMHDITALDYHRLLIYHHACGVAAQAAGKSLSWLNPTCLSRDAAMWSPSKPKRQDSFFHEIECSCKAHAGSMLQVANFGEMKIASWFSAYLDSSRKELWERPSVSTIQESAAYNSAVSSASKCTTCCHTVTESMNKFRAAYIAQVKKVVAAVKLVTS
ncbi:hypothetical protein CY34DRAFT_805233 [Suillus luteus UH-Slu-Lm8-n1]|uniref:BTB domain-containing protein n=1 Tax=Suillus luteus UH-Slu-Lm8-n1 TaxID=930992 RepID=A0A0D0BFV5_9AGAM|nr:hypothetical protein CY34DRAFT_805233 [Suillus luteus UH-Slu-Lm8-n1]